MDDLFETHAGDSELWQVASLIRSKNAGPFEITIDVMCDNADAFERLCNSRLMDPSLYAELYKTDVRAVDVFAHRESLAIKASFPRPTPSGSTKDTDVYGGQFHSLLVRLPVRQRGDERPPHRDAAAAMPDPETVDES